MSYQKAAKGESIIHNHELVKRIIAAYDNGESRTSIANRLNYRESQIGYVLANTPKTRQSPKLETLITKDELYKKYIIDGKTAKEIGLDYDKSPDAVMRLIHKWNVTTETDNINKKIANALSAKNITYKPVSKADFNNNKPVQTPPPFIPFFGKTTTTFYKEIVWQNIATFLLAAATCDASYNDWSDFLHKPYSTIRGRFADYNWRAYARSEGGTSAEEKHLAKHLSSKYKLPLTIHDRSVLNGHEIDILIPDLKLGFELSPTITHNSDSNRISPKPATYHQQKALLAKKKNINLITIFTNTVNMSRIDDFITTAMNTSKKQYARNTTCKLITKTDARTFMNAYHDAGYRNATVHYGLFDKTGKLIEVASFGKPQNTIENDVELYRLATISNTTVVGGFSKLLTHYHRDNPKSQTLLTYADLDTSNGNTYAQFAKTETVTVPSYEWRHIKDDVQPISRYQSQKRILAKKYPQWSDLSESEIMHKLGYAKIYHCGNLKYTINLNQF